MNTLIKFYIAFFLFSPLVSQAQAPNGNDIVVEISKEKILVNNKTFFLHKVKKGENLYRISKAYNVAQKDIIIANPETISGNIKEGQVLKIPAETSAIATPPLESDNFIYHIVEEKQTIYSLTQKYKVTQDQIFKFNPDLQSSPLQIGQVVKIPKSISTPSGTDKFKPVVKYEEYKVGRRETMYSIAKDHNISVNELITANPILNTEDLKKGQIIQIPVKSDNEIVSVSTISKIDTTRHFYAINDTTPCNAYKPFSEGINVAMLLPISVEGNETLQLLDSIMSASVEKRNYESNEVYQLTTNVLEFYQGALLAVDSLKKAGMSIKFCTFDTGKDNQKIASVLSKPELTQMDLIIGPLTYNTEIIEKTAQYALKNKIKMVSPVSPNIKVVKDNPYVFQVTTNEAFNIETMLKYIANTYQQKNIILINTTKESDRDTFNLFKAYLNTYFPNQYKVFNYTDDPKQIDHLVLAKTDNLVLLPSDHEATVNRLLNYLNYMPQSLSIKVFGLSSWTVFKGLEQEKGQGFLHNLEVQYGTSYFVDFNSSEVKNFLHKYKQYYKSEPSYHTRDNSPQFLTKEGYNLSFLGYDITFYFLDVMGRSGRNFENCINQQNIKLLHTNIRFERQNQQDGFVNKGVSIVKYTKDYFITKAN